jgi:Arc/MetJ-type ribon-helix-helix transcriptional regulator
MTQVAIQLPDELSQFVNQSVRSGGFHNADEFFISVVSMYKDQVEEGLGEADQTKLESLRHDIQVGIDQLDRGEASEMNWDEFFAQRHRSYAERHCTA